MSTIKQIMIQKGQDKDLRGLSTDADKVVYDNGESGLSASNVQQALDELSVKVNNKTLVAETKMDKENPTGIGSLSINRKPNTVIGNNSIAVGDRNEASGENSFAEGEGTTASGLNSHSAGSDTTASGPNSFAIGSSTEASGAESLAMGARTIASGNQSFAGGTDTSAIAENSFAFGKDNIVEYDSSIALGEGLYPTVPNEVVVGKYNDEKVSYDIGAPTFVVGVGTEENHKDGFVVLNDGTTIANNDVQIKNGDKIISLKEINTKVKEGFYKELTQREYNNLSEKEKNNGTVYYIKDSDPFDVAWDKVKLSRFGANDASIKFGVDADGNFGYIKPGADTVIPFNANRKGSNLMKMYAPKVAFFTGRVVEIKEIKENE